MAKPIVDIVICTHNNELIIVNCLKSVQKLVFPFRKCIVVDDCSTDKTVDGIKNKFPWVEVIRKKFQSGPSESRNIAINQSDADYMLFLDSDVIVTKKFLTFLVRAITKMENVAICGGKLLLPDGLIDSAGGGITKLGIGFDIGHKQSKLNFNQGKDVMYVPSAAMLVSRKLIKEIGAFDGTYFYGHEDTDLCWRVNMAGFRVYYEPRALAFHHKNQTIEKMMDNVHYYGTRNRIRSLIKNHQFSTLVPYLFLYMSYSLVDIIIRPYRKQKLAAWWWNIWHIQETLQERRSIQNLRVFYDNELPFSRLRDIIKQILSRN